MKPLCIYHANCVDGFGAAWVVRRRFGAGNVDFCPSTYQMDPPDVAGRDLILVDFSFKRPVLERIVTEASSVLVLDHHATAQADLYDLPGATTIFDMSYSGAVLAWMHFFPDQPVPALLAYIQDRDLWRFALPRSRDVAAGLFSHPYDFEMWDVLLEGGSAMVSTLADDGHAIERKHRKDVAELVKALARPMVVGGQQVLGANVPYTYSSDAGHALIECGSLFGVCYYDSPNGRSFSLRSTDQGPDVAEIARQYGGGGHRNAAGFRMPLSDLAQFEIVA